MYTAMLQLKKPAEATSYVEYGLQVCRKAEVKIDECMYD